MSAAPSRRHRARRRCASRRAERTPGRNRSPRLRPPRPRSSLRATPVPRQLTALRRERDELARHTARAGRLPSTAASACSTCLPSAQRAVRTPGPPPSAASSIPESSASIHRPAGPTARPYRALIRALSSRSPHSPPGSPRPRAGRAPSPEGAPRTPPACAGCPSRASRSAAPPDTDHVPRRSASREVQRRPPAGTAADPRCRPPRDRAARRAGRGRTGPSRPSTEPRRTARRRS